MPFFVHSVRNRIFTLLQGIFTLIYQYIIHASNEYKNSCEQRCSSLKFPLVRKPGGRLSFKDRQISDLMPRFEPSAEEMRRVFVKMSDGGRAIDQARLRSLLENLKDAGSAHREAKKMLQVADLNRDGVIDFGEFMEVHKRGVRASEIKGAFWVFDRDGDGRIGAEELRDVMSRLGEEHSLDECRKMVKRVDKNGDGVVDMDEFMDMMTSTMKPL